jgi:hypothetical protein
MDESTIALLGTRAADLPKRAGGYSESIVTSVNHRDEEVILLHNS